MIVINAFNVRTDSFNIFKNILMNKGFIQVMALIFVLQIVFTYIGGNILRTTALTVTEWLMIFGIALVIIPVDMVRKLIFK
jgi:magnesium-transporting ATPase (P-type)